MYKTGPIYSGWRRSCRCTSDVVERIKHAPHVGSVCDNEFVHSFSYTSSPCPHIPPSLLPLLHSFRPPLLLFSNRSLLRSAPSFILSPPFPARSSASAPFAGLSFIAKGTGKEREEALDTFRSDPECHCLLMCMRSTSSSGHAGLTLTEATHAFLLEPIINFGLEEQAIGRIHRWVGE